MVNVIPKFCLTVCMLLLGVMVLTGCASAPKNDPEALAEYQKTNDPMEVAPIVAFLALTRFLIRS